MDQKASVLPTSPQHFTKYLSAPGANRGFVYVFDVKQHDWTDLNIVFCLDEPEIKDSTCNRKWLWNNVYINLYTW